MKRMKTFLTYALLIIGFFILSTFLENGLLKSMYRTISGEFDGRYEATGTSFSIENTTAKACNINGYMAFDIVNTTGKFIDKCYVKVDLYNKQNLLAVTNYIEISEIQSGDLKPVNIKFKANNIEKFTISIVKNTPDKTNIINILGWELDLSNLFGLGIDLTNISIFGTKLPDMFNWQNIKSTAGGFWDWLVAIAQRVPVWAYGLGWLCVIGLI